MDFYLVNYIEGGIFRWMNQWETGYWAEIVRRINEGDRSGVEQLYSEVRGLVRGKFLGNFSSSAPGYCFEDSVHEVLLILLETIRGGQLRDPAKLPAFVRTVARRQMVAHIRSAVAGRRAMSGVERPGPVSPEAHLSDMETSRWLRDALERLNPRDREILKRFYFEEQPAKQICGEMRLTGTQFRLYKSRAIAKCSNWLVNRPTPAELRIA